jgi:hypothetical protein
MHCQKNISMKIRILVLVILSFNCSSKKTSEQLVKLEASDVIDTTEITKEPKLTVQKIQLDSSKITHIHISGIDVGFYEVDLWNPEQEVISTDCDTALVSPDIGSTIQGKLLLINSSGISDLKVEQQYETSITISNEGPHLDLIDWKHYTSEWKEVSALDQNIYKTLKYSTQEYLTFPEFTEDELYDYVNNLGRPKWAELIKNPVYQDGQTHYSPGISIIRFRLTGTKENGEQIEKYIICEIAMGCSIKKHRGQQWRASIGFHFKYQAWCRSGTSGD